MALTSNDIKKVAHLARLTIPDEEIEGITQNIISILDLVAVMNRIDTTQQLPMAHPLDEKQPLRADQVTEINQRELFQSIAPEIKAGLYVVPPVIEAE